MALFYIFASLSDVGLAGESWVPLSGSGSSLVPYSVLTEVSESCAASQMWSQKRESIKAFSDNCGYSLILQMATGLIP